MPRKRQPEITTEALAALGAERLASLIAEEAACLPDVRRAALRALTEREAPQDLVGLLRRQLRTIYSRDFFSRSASQGLSHQVESLTRAALTEVLPRDPVAAAAFFEDAFLRAESALGEGDDSDGALGEATHLFGEAWGAALAAIPDLDRQHLAERLWFYVQQDDFGLRDQLLPWFAAALSTEGLDHLERLVRSELARPSDRRQTHEAFTKGGVLPASLLANIADLRGDPDLYLEAKQVAGASRFDQVEISRRYLAAGRAEEALAWLRDPLSRSGQVDAADYLEVSVLEKLGQAREAQELRWKLFQENLDSTCLSEFLERLESPTERNAAEQRARDLAMAFESAEMALDLFLEADWLSAASELVERRHAEISGRDYMTLVPAADALESNYPRAAARLYRSMIESILARAASQSYRHAARHLHSAAGCDTRCEPQEEWEPHDAFLARLRQQHRRKYRFWELADKPPRSGARPKAKRRVAVLGPHAIEP